MRRGKKPAIGAHSLVWKLFGWTAGCIAAVLLAAILLLQKLWGGEDAR